MLSEILKSEDRLLKNVKDKRTYEDNRILHKKLKKIIKRYKLPTTTKVLNRAIVINSLDKSVMITWYRTHKRLMIWHTGDFYRCHFLAETLDEVILKLVKHRML